jgi:ribonuclease D
MKINLFANDIPSTLNLEGDLALDTEAMGLTITRDRLCLIQISTGNQEVYLVQFDNNYDAPNLKKLLSDTKSTKIFHFARFDLAVIRHYLGVRIENVFCTQIASKIARTYTESHGLKDLCKELLQENISKEQQSSDWGKMPLSREQQHYAASDVLHLHKLREILIEMLTRESRIDLANKIFAFLNTRVDLDLLGWQNADIFAHTGIKKSAP